jgi:putative ABC transport system permease protein
MAVVPKLARRSLRARIGRSIAIALAILASVSFVSGSFILADSLKHTFDNLFSELNENIDLQARAVLTVDDISAVRDPVPSSLRDTVAQVPGVANAEGSLQRFAQMLDKDGEAVKTNGAPALGVSWSDDPDLNGVTLKDGRPPQASDEVVIDKLTADDNDFEVGDQITIVFDAGPATFTIVGLVGLGDTDGFGGATLAAFATEFAPEILGAGDTYDSIDVRIEETADLETVKAAVEDVLPPRTEVVTGEQVGEEASDSINEIISIFGTGLLIFAFVTAFIAAFIINNIFGITIGQRLRELALMRGVGASSKQVKRLISLEAMIISVTATVLGIVAGFGVAKLIITLFNSAGAGFPSSTLILRPPAVIVSLIVGVGVTMVSVYFPARRAGKVPPVAAMRPEIGYAAITSSRRLVIGGIVTGLGAAMFVIGLFASPGGAFGLIALAGGGALLIFIGIASLSTTVARPVAGAIGAPIQKLFGASGKIARDNAMRSPRRTARTASALMIGVALISAAALFTSSIRDTFGRILQRSVTADFIVLDPSFLGVPPQVGENIAGLDIIEAVSPLRNALVDVEDDQVGVSAVDPIDFPQLVDLDVTDGDWSGVTADDGLMLSRDKADDFGVGVGDQLDLTFSNGVERPVEVAGVYDDASLGDWYISARCRLRAPSARPARAGVGERRGRRRRGASRDPIGDRRLPASRAPDQRRVPQRSRGPDRSAVDRDHDAARLRHRDLLLRHRHHAGVVGVRAHAGDRSVACRRHEPAPVAPRRAMGGGDRVGVRRGGRRRRGHADWRSVGVRRPQRLHRRHHDPMVHARPRRHPRCRGGGDRCVVPGVQGVAHERARGDLPRVIA